MKKTTAKTLQRQIAQHDSVARTTLFYVDSGRIYTWDDRYDTSVTTGFGIEIDAVGNNLHPDVLALLADADVALRNDLTQLGRFRTVP